MASYLYQPSPSFLLAPVAVSAPAAEKSLVSLRHLLFGCFLLGLAACMPTLPDLHDAAGGSNSEAGFVVESGGRPPPTPILAPIPDSTRYNVVTLKGSARGAHSIIVRGAGNTLS